LLLLLVLLMVRGNCDGVPVGVCGDSGVKTEDVDDTGLPMLLALVVIADVNVAVAAADVLLQLLLLFAVVGVAGVDMATADDAVDCGAVVAGGDCCC